MDYRVFIVSRIRETFDRGASMDEAISRGISSTAGVVTSAAIVRGVLLPATIKLLGERLRAVRARRSLRPGPHGRRNPGDRRKKRSARTRNRAAPARTCWAPRAPSGLQARLQSFDARGRPLRRSCQLGIEPRQPRRIQLARIL